MVAIRQAKQQQPTHPNDHATKAGAGFAQRSGMVLLLSMSSHFLQCRLLVKFATKPNHMDPGMAREARKAAAAAVQQQLQYGCCPMAVT